MVAYRQEQEVLSKGTVSLEAQMSLALQSQPKEPQLTRDPAQEPHPVGETGEGQDLSGVEHIPPGLVQHIPPGQAQMDRKTRAGKPGGEKNALPAMLRASGSCLYLGRLLNQFIKFSSSAKCLLRLP